jgi:glycosyltransferase involved in cell wall biosynthesis
MRILIDGGCWSNARGYGRFTRELLRALARAPRHDYTVLLEEQDRASFSLPFSTVFVKLLTPTAEAATASSRRSIRDLLAMSRAAKHVAPDGVFYPSVYSYFPLIAPVPALLGVHDTMADRFPEFAFDSRTQQRFWRWKMRLALWQCRDILTVSQYSKGSIAGYWGVSEGRVHVIPEGPASLFQPQDIPKRDMVLSVGGISPNKNLATLVRAFSNVQAGVELWIAGGYESDGFKTCYRELAALAASRPVRFLGRVTDETLCRLYCEARLLAFPSLEEGFGLPAVEAMACGLPVVAHNGHALAEVLGDAGLLVDARDENALTAAINQVLSNATVAESMRSRGLARAAQFSWKRAAEDLQNIFDAIWM